MLIHKILKEKLAKDRMRTVGNVLIVRGSGEKILLALAKYTEAFTDVFINDPPYGTTQCPWDTVIPMDLYWKAANACCVKKAPQIVFGSQPFTSVLVGSNLSNFRHELIWDKRKCGSPGLAKIRPQKVHENIAVFSQQSGHYYYPVMEEGEPYTRIALTQPKKQINNHKYGLKAQDIVNTGSRYPKSIRIVSRNFSAQQQVHPTQKPVPLLEWLLETYSAKNGFVTDLSCGSGSTGVAAIQTNRPALLIEKDPKYFKLACDWCTAVYGGKPWDPAEYRREHLT